MARRERRRKVSLKERRKLRENHKRSRIVKDARKVFDAVYESRAAGVIVVERAACLYHAACVIYAAYHHGVDLTVQAGTSAWPRIPEAEDDGSVDTHFGYEWQGISSVSSREALAAGHLPEIHVWAAEIRTQSIVDTSTRYIQEQCDKTTDLEWRMPAPPDYIWLTGEEMPDRWFYEPSEVATRFILDAVRNSVADIGRILNGRLP